jgi:hypothetical protein
MTGPEMKEYFVTELTQWRKKPRIDSKDIYYWLNFAQDAFIEARFADGDFNRTRRVTEDLRPLFVKDSSQPATYVGEILEGFHCDEATLPADHLFLVAVRAVTLSTSAPEQTVGVVRSGSSPKTKIVKIVQSDDVYRLLDDPFHRPQKRSGIGDLTGGEFHVYTDESFVVSSLSFDYIKEPTAISDGAGSDLPDFVHNDLVTQAVTLFLNKEQEVLQKHQSNSLESLT